jgi:hypothetical protein
LDIERRSDSIACEQPESSLATFFRQFLLDLFPAVKFAGVRQKNGPSIYFESSPAHHTPLHNQSVVRHRAAAAVDWIAP